MGLLPTSGGGKTNWNPLVLAHFFPYIVRNVLAAFLPPSKKPRIVPSLPSYRSGDRPKTLAELISILLLQTAFGAWVGWDPVRYALLGVLPVLLASSVIMVYVFTNHFLDPIRPTADPLLCSTSVVVPRWVDWLHGNFSYHTEHHVFPSMAPRYYPILSRALSREFPERYRRIRIGVAWGKLGDKEPAQSPSIT